MGLVGLAKEARDLAVERRDKRSMVGDRLHTQTAPFKGGSGFRKDYNHLSIHCQKKEKGKVGRTWRLALAGWATSSRYTKKSKVSIVGITARRGKQMACTSNGRPATLKHTISHTAQRKRENNTQNQVKSKSSPPTPCFRPLCIIREPRTSSSTSSKQQPKRARLFHL